VGGWWWVAASVTGGRRAGGAGGAIGHVVTSSRGHTLGVTCDSSHIKAARSSCHLAHTATQTPNTDQSGCEDMSHTAHERHRER
jgi:hypothetical protein